MGRRVSEQPVGSSHDKSCCQSKWLPSERKKVLVLMQQRGINLCPDVVVWSEGWGGWGVPLKLHTQTLNYMLVHEHMGGSVRINTHWQTQRRLWVGHWGLIEDPARAPALIKFTVLVLVRFSRENKHSPLGLSPGG